MRGTVGNIVLGKVTRVLPGMQAAFIDVGMERAAFLHVEDLIRPDDFEAYLTRGSSSSDASEGGRRASGLVEDLDFDIGGDEDADEDEDEQESVIRLNQDVPVVGARLGAADRFRRGRVSAHCVGFSAAYA